MGEKGHPFAAIESPAVESTPVAKQAVQAPKSRKWLSIRSVIPVGGGAAMALRKALNSVREWSKAEVSFGR